MKSSLRRRISPSTPFALQYTNADGSKITDTFQLSYDFNTLALVEEKLGKSMLMDIGEILENPSVKNVSVLLWAAVQENHPEYEGEDGLFALRCNLTIGAAREALAACSVAFVSQLPPEQQEKLKAIQAAREAGEPAPSPLDQRPTPAVA